MEIPKIIHYCWFGRQPLPKSAIKFIDSWKKFLPDYKILEWNEDNFDVNLIRYTHSAYQAKKYAFVSDYARYWVLYHHGGIYFDTDVEIIRPLDDVIAQGPFMGLEKDNNQIHIAPGLGMGAVPKMSFYKEIMSVFENVEIHEPIKPIMIRETTELFLKKGFKTEDSRQTIDGITLYPNDYFNPKDDYTGKIILTENTRAIHHYAKSWVPNYGPIRNKLTQLYHKILKNAGLTISASIFHSGWNIMFLGCFSLYIFA
ncbi:MAG: glycosyl transferase [Muribaculaceae bacterium]|nr:glycosyl transferase [Muribaculaceae bacterium]